VATFASEQQIQRDTDSAEDLRWWDRELAPKDAHKKLIAAITKIEALQKWRRQADLVHMRLYGNAPIVGFGAATYAKPSQLTGGKVGLNVVKNCSDAFVAKITKDEAKVSFVTSGADWDLQQKARALEKFVDGQCYELKVADVLPLAVLDSCIFGTGILHPYKQGDGKERRLGLERVPTWSLRVDEQEALYGKPRSFYRELFIDRHELLYSAEWDDDAKKAIQRARIQNDDVDKIGYSSTADQVRVVLAHHLPSRSGMSEEETDGAYAITLNEAMLSVEPYTYDKPPYVFFRRQLPPLGFWGIGLAEELRGLQVELNTLMQKIQRSFHLLGSGHWIIEKNSRVNKHKIDNDPSSIVEFVGTAPQLVAANPVPPQIFEHLDRIYQRCYEITGISQLEAQSQKPKGLNSGVAIDNYIDITTERFNVAARLKNSAMLELAEWILRLSREICDEGNADFTTMATDKHDAHPVSFAKNELRKDQYVLKMWATNALADDPSEKMEQVERMANANWIDPQTARRLLDFPDLEHAQNLEDASFNAVEKCISLMMKDEVYRGPQPFLDLGVVGPDGKILPGTALKQVTMALVKAWSEGAPESKLVLLKQWVSDAMAEVMKNAPPPQLSAPAMPGSPGMAPLLPGQAVAPAADPMAMAAMASGGMPPGAAPPMPPGVPVQ
jgi:hypothetical protein